LVVKADGTKFGKTESGSVWLDPARTSPYAFFQFWLRTSDAEVGSFLRRFTFLPRERIAVLDEAIATHPEQRQAQRALAFEVTAMVHGEGEAHRAEAAAAVLFTAEIAQLDEVTLQGALADAPSTIVSPAAVEGELTVVDALLLTHLCASKRDARQQLSQGAIYLNGVRISEDRPLGPGDVLHGRWVVLRKGRGNQAVLVVGDH
jgi:tyrosyl-tRNA synthetase